MAAAPKPLSFQKSVLSEEEFKEAIAFRGLTGTTGHSHVPLTDCRPLLVQLWRFALSGAENANVLRPLSNAWRWRWTINPLDSASLLLRRSPFEPRAMACPIASSIRARTQVDSLKEFAGHPRPTFQFYKVSARFGCAPNVLKHATPSVLQNGDLLETVEGVDMPKICDLILLNS